MNYIEVRRVRGLIEDRVGFNHAKEKKQQQICTSLRQQTGEQRDHLNATAMLIYSLPCNF